MFRWVYYAETNFQFEVIIHDDAFTDNTASIIKEYEEKYPDIIKPIYQIENQYSKKASIIKEYILPKVEGKYIALCEGDDFRTDNLKLQIQFDALEANKDCNLCVCTVRDMALELSMQALGLTGEIITTPFTFASTTHAIVRNNLTPVFCDINPDDCTIDVDKIESLITEKTSAIVPVHVYGNICNVEAIQRIADKCNLKVIYDAAHTFGVTYKGKGIGSFGDVSCFSFHAKKVFNTIEGGAVCFKDKAFGEEIYNLKNFGIRGQETVSGVGANAKMNEFCAAMGLCNLKHIDEEIAKRKN